MSTEKIILPHTNLYSLQEFAHSSAWPQLTQLNIGTRENGRIVLLQGIVAARKQGIVAFPKLALINGHSVQEIAQNAGVEWVDAPQAQKTTMRTGSTPHPRVNPDVFGPHR